MGLVAYELQLPSTSRIHPVFHISRLKLAVGDSSSGLKLPSLDDIQGPIHTPMAVLGERTVKRQGKFVFQWLVQWTGLPPEDSTWEDMISVSKYFSPTDPKDEVRFSSTGGKCYDPATKEFIRCGAAELGENSRRKQGRPNSSKSSAKENKEEA